MHVAVSSEGATSHGHSSRASLGFAQLRPSVAAIARRIRFVVACLTKASERVTSQLYEGPGREVLLRPSHTCPLFPMLQVRVLHLVHVFCVRVQILARTRYVTIVSHRILYCCPDQGYQAPGRNQIPNGHRALGNAPGAVERAAPAVSVAISVQEGSSTSSVFNSIMACLKVATTRSVAKVCVQGSPPTNAPTTKPSSINALG